MKKNTQKVSIIMATYNRAHLIEETLNSIINQSYKNWECLIIDDESTDNTKETLRPYLLKDPRLNYYQRNKGHKKGLPGCRNQGLKLANGNFIIFFDDDDIVHPDNLKICVKEFEHFKVDFCRYRRETFYGDFNLEFERNEDYKTIPLNINDIEAIIIGKIPFNSCQVMWKQECFNKAQFNESLMYAEEWELYSRILSTGKIGISIDKVLFYGRKHINSNTGEFHNNDPVRRDSYVKAIKLVVENLYQKGLLTEALKKYFLRLGFFLRNELVVDYILKHSGYNKYLILKYKLGFKFYPVLRPIFVFKSKLKN